MATVKVIPMIGRVSHDTLASLQGCHALHERAVVKSCNSETAGKAIHEAISEALLTFRPTDPTTLQFVVQFRL